MRLIAFLNAETLVLSLDRLPANELVMTQELIANMLGVRRESVTQAASNEQKAGLITYHRGHIIVLDRAGLEARTCECYAVVKKEFDRLLPYRVGQGTTDSPSTIYSASFQSRKRITV